jgi:hypothetical protein
MSNGSFKSFVDDVVISTVRITTPSGKQKAILPQVLAIRIQEDVETPYMFAEVDIGDGVGLLQELPIHGEEIIDLEFKIPVLEKVLKFKFWVFAVSNVSSNQKNNANFYRLKCISPEMMTNASRLVAKGYRDTFSNIVQDIVSNYLKSSKPLESVSTLGAHEWVVGSKKPLQAIDQIRRRAVSTQNPYSPMLFFETPSGFNLNDLASLYEKGTKQSPEDITYTYMNVNVDDARLNRIIVSYNAPEKRDTFEQVNNGAFRNDVTTYDIITKELKTYNFDYKDKKQSFKFFNDPSTHAEEFVDNVTAEASRSYLIPIDSTRPDFFVDRVGDKQSYTNMILQNVSLVKLSGSGASFDSIHAGSVVYLDFPHEMLSYREQKPIADTENSGFFFVKKVVHEINAVTQPASYGASCELIAGTTLEKIG